MCTSPATELLESGFAVLQEEEWTMRQCLMRLIALLGVAVCAWFLLVATLGIFWHPAFEWLSQPSPIFVIYLLFCAMAWKKVGLRRISVDLQKRQWVIEAYGRNERNGVQVETIPFHDLLLLRYWQGEEEYRSAAFIIMLQVSKNVSKPDCAGYCMHMVDAGSDPVKAEQDSAAVVASLCQRTGIEYVDVSNSGEERFARWSRRGRA